jgi:hypothetical protein
MARDIKLTHGKEYFSKSQLSKLHISTGAFDDYINGVKTQSSALTLGTLVHEYILEPEKFNKKYFFLDDSRIREIIQLYNDTVNSLKDGVVTIDDDKMDLFNENFFIVQDLNLVKEIGGKNPRATKKYKAWFGELEADNIGKMPIREDSKPIEKVTLSSIYKKWLAEETSRRGGKTPISGKDAIALKRIKDNLILSENALFDTFLTGGEAEKTIEETVVIGEGLDAVTFPALAIIDYDLPHVSIDLKTTSSTLDRFKWDAKKFGYDIQAKLTSSMNGKPFVFIVAQTVEPFDVGYFTCSGLFLQSGEGKILDAMENYQLWKDGVYSTYSEEL